MDQCATNETCISGINNVINLTPSLMLTMLCIIALEATIEAQFHLIQVNFLNFRNKTLNVKSATKVELISISDFYPK